MDKHGKNDKEKSKNAPNVVATDKNKSGNAPGKSSANKAPAPSPGKPSTGKAPVKTSDPPIAKPSQISVPSHVVKPVPVPPPVIITPALATHQEKPGVTPAAAPAKQLQPGQTSVAAPLATPTSKVTPKSPAVASPNSAAPTNQQTPGIKGPPPPGAPANAVSPLKPSSAPKPGASTTSAMPMSEAEAPDYIPVRPHPPGKKLKIRRRRDSYDHEGLIKSPDRSRRVILTKRFILLFVILVVIVVSGIGTAAWSLHQQFFGYPPTEFSIVAYSNTLFALISLCFVSFSSIVILRAKMRHLAIGYLIMFLYVMTFYFALKGVSRAYMSIKYDDIVSIEKYVFSKYKNRSLGELPQFFHRLQTNFKCCGTNTIDRMEDWPERLQTDDMPRSCCKLPTTACGKKLARTRTYDGTYNEPMRIPSGYFLVLTENELDGIVKSGKPVKILRVPGKDAGLNTVLKIIRDFYLKSLAEGYLPGTPLNQMKTGPNDIAYPEQIDPDHLPVSIGCRDPASFEKVITVGWQIQYMLDFETSRLHISSSSVTYDWFAWKIPMCQEIVGQPPFHLASNLNRDTTNLQEGVKQMWYISRGIPENYVLKDLIWERYCEDEKNHQLIPDIPLVSAIVGHDDKRGKTIGKFYIAFVHRLMTACLAISSTVIFLLLVVFIIFWKYYSRMKVEVYANLPYAPEFEALKVRRSDLYEPHDKAEYKHDGHQEENPTEALDGQAGPPGHDKKHGKAAPKAKKPPGKHVIDVSTGLMQNENLDLDYE